MKKQDKKPMTREQFEAALTELELITGKSQLEIARTMQYLLDKKEKSVRQKELRDNLKFMNIKESIYQILSDKKAKRDGLHVKHIARHIHNLNNNLFSDLSEIGFDILKRKVNRILANDVKKKRKNMFVKVINPKTNKFRKGYYKLKPSRFAATKPAQ